MALFPPLEFGGPSTSYGRPSISLLEPSRRSGKRGLFDVPSRKNRRKVHILDPFLHSHTLEQPDQLGLQDIGHDPLLAYQNPLGDLAIKAAPLPAFEAFRSVPIQPDFAITLKPALPASEEVKALRKNRLEVIAELFITITTTRADCVSLVSSTPNVVHPEETLYRFKDSNGMLPPSLSRSSSAAGGGKDVFASMYKPQAAKSTKCSLTGRNTRLWRMAIASLLLRSVAWSAFDARKAMLGEEIDEHGPFESAVETFNFLYGLLYDITAHTTRGFEMTAIASKKAIFNLVCEYAVLGSSSEVDMSASSVKKIDYLSGMGEYEGRLIIYMAQVVANFLIPSRPDPVSAKVEGENTNRPSIQGIVETTPAQVPNIGSVGQYAARVNRELEEIQYLLMRVDEGTYEPNLEDVMAQTFKLPTPLPLKERSI
ncbi:hypothetical protein P389DRAFT_187622 [Cystobasidium minutum MCA 4210]|uniref:uncharacterized protein n=1 Tax=Cystobasidium minutum MCA 4210 TaxID=1397322 RepID=UPI0034CE0ABB|eukprot:jgi/Rhomi1/187622/estExt_fgenesh1_pg.C_1_t20469